MFFQLQIVVCIQVRTYHVGQPVNDVGQSITNFYQKNVKINK